MKKILLLATLLLACCGSAWGYGIVNNSGSLGSDSLCIPFYLLDSTGNPGLQLADGDSVWLCVFYPSGAVAYDSGYVYNDANKITAKAYHGKYYYSFKIAVTTIVGTARNGTYGYILSAMDRTGAALETPHAGTFQLYTTSDFGAKLDSLYKTSSALSATANDAIWEYASSSVTSTSGMGLLIRDSIKNVASRLTAARAGYLDLLNTYLDATISSRSTLAASDNIGINWADVSNPTTTVGLTGTTVGTVTALTGKTGFGLAPDGLDADTSFTQVQAAIAGLNDIDGTAVKLAPDGLDADTSFDQVQGLLGTNLDAAISSRSTLAATDNIGINWADVSNPTTTLGLTNTTIGIVTLTATTTDVTNPDTAGLARTADIPTAVEIGVQVWRDSIAVDTPAVGFKDWYHKEQDSIFMDSTAVAKQVSDSVWAKASRTLSAFAFKSGLTAGAIDSIWDEDTTGHATDGTFGAVLHDSIDLASSNISAGSGADTLTWAFALALIDSIYAEDTTGHTIAGNYAELFRGLPLLTDLYTVDTNANGNLKVDVISISADTAAADNSESFFDGTGYAGTNNVIPLVTVTTDVTNPDTAGLARTADSVSYRAVGFSTFDPATTAVTPTDTTETNEELAVKSDSVIYQGAASGVTIASIKSLVVDTLDVARDATKADYMADVTGIQTEVDNLDGWTPATAFPAYFSSLAITDSGSISYVDTVYKSTAGSTVWDSTQRDSVLAAIETDNIARVEDSTAFQGVAGSVTDSSIYAYFTDGSNEDQFKASVSGSGANSCTIYAIDTSGTDAVINSISVTVRDSATSSLIASQTTGASGTTSWSLDDGTYWVGASGPNGAYVFPGSQYMTVSGATTDSVFGYDFSAGVPDSANLCRVYGWVVKLDNTPVKGATVSLTPNISIDVDSLFVGDKMSIPTAVYTNTNADGYWYLDVQPNVLLDSNSTYTLRIESQSLSAEAATFKPFQVPNSASVAVKTLIER